ncbi:hypothetical protein [Streptomyces purpurogeneiscleroticus]|uniref:hypothetical protein n=1 Tax=Streptomyces purpurogeneiscleroticus TaxID=68259 RepID=UPI001CBF4B86|nr:hypothetical protein [Streptomyces purpurogeneiscleroticus]MBZ4017005.1 hypothetical protein [Streptomyces purpurogeneiscleroticus]
MDRRMRHAAALRALLAVFALVVSGLTPTATAATTAPYADRASYVSMNPEGPPHAHDGSAHPTHLPAVLRTSGRTAPAEQHVAHPAPGLGPAGRYTARPRALAWLPVRRDTTDGHQFSAGLRPARAPPLSSR